MKNYTFSFPTTIHFGPGVRMKVSAALKDNQVTRPLIVTDKGISEFAFVKQIREDLTSAGLKVAQFSEIFGNPTKSQVANGVEAYKAHEANGIVGIGGGAALDVAKAIALMATHPGDLFDYEDEKPGARPFNNTIPFWIALPTTAGTGSEVGRSSVISDDQTHVKKIIFSPKLLAKIVFADPELTLELPAKITAATGMDALTHCIEAFLAKGYHPICDGIALEGVRLCALNLEKAVNNPSDLEARSGMLLASLMGAVAFQKGLGLVHSCAHALSTVCNLHHGLANAIMIDHALPFNLSAVPDRFLRMGSTIGLKNATPESFIQWLSNLKKQIGIPAKLSECGVKPEQKSSLVELAFQDSCHQCNPRPCTANDFAKIFTEAF